MTDLEMTRFCAIAMALPMVGLVRGQVVYGSDAGSACKVYDPLHDDAQAMALAKKFRLAIRHASTKHGYEDSDLWIAAFICDPDNYEGVHANLNRAIVECVARMQKEKR